VVVQVAFVTWSVLAPREKIKGEARMSWDKGTMGGSGALISAIIRAISSLDM